MMQIKIFIDLEETFITDIDSCKPIPRNIDLIKKYIDEAKANSVYEVKLETFTFALYNEYDKYNVERAIKFFDGYDIIVQDWYTKDMRREFICKILFNVSDKDMLDFNYFANKERVFEWYCREYYKGYQTILIDDTVTDRLSIYYDHLNNIENMIRFNNIKSMVERK